MCIYTSTGNNFEKGLECFKNPGVLAVTWWFSGFKSCFAGTSYLSTESC